MVVATDYPFMDIFWTMLVFVAWVIWFWMLISLLTDVFRRHDIGGWRKAGWTVFLILLPFLGVLCYLITNGREMAQRQGRGFSASRPPLEGPPSTSASPAEEIDKAKTLLDGGVIDRAEFEVIKANALGRPVGSASATVTQTEGGDAVVSPAADPRR